MSFGYTPLPSFSEIDERVSRIRDELGVQNMEYVGPSGRRLPFYRTAGALVVKDDLIGSLDIEQRLRFFTEEHPTMQGTFGLQWLLNQVPTSIWKLPVPFYRATLNDVEGSLVRISNTWDNVKVGEPTHKLFIKPSNQIAYSPSLEEFQDSALAESFIAQLAQVDFIPNTDSAV